MRPCIREVSRQISSLERRNSQYGNITRKTNLIIITHVILAKFMDLAYSLTFMKADQVSKTGSISVLRRNGRDTLVHCNLLDKAEFHD
jgi:hypothetical protein